MMATNFVSASYNEIYDLSTQAGDVTTLKFHAPQGTLPQQYLKGFWTQFKKYRYYGSKIMMIPVATLPADPLQISYEAGETTIDPRDMVNPILHKVYRGEALVDDFSTGGSRYSGVDEKVYNSSAAPTVGEEQYYATLQDPSWKKAHVQRGFRAKGIPLVRKLASNIQIGGGSHFGANIVEPSPYDWSPMEQTHAQHGEPGIATASPACNLVGPQEPRYDGTTNPATYELLPNDEHNYTEMFTSGWDKLGWLDTSQRTWSGFAPDGRSPAYTDVTIDTGTQGFRNREFLTRLPRVFTYIAILPPSYKQEMYFRLVINHQFGFKDFRSANMPWDGSTDMPTTTTPITAVGYAPAAKSLSVETDADVKLTSVGVS